jgi:NAD(P)-dependent dehydrogenase (short-subunit alcohol dehydrogenase family)
VTRGLALVAGSGGVLGDALLREFAAAGYTVAGLRRASCDFGDAAATRDAIGELVAQHGPVEALLYNAGHLVVEPFLDTTPDALRASLDAGPVGAANCARAVLPGMLARGGGCMVFTGATASLRGSANFAAMSAGKFGLRGLAQALAREFQPHRIHVAHVVLDGLLQGSASTLRFGRDGQPAMDAATIAGHYRWLAGQPPTAWTHELDFRTTAEKF